MKYSGSSSSSNIDITTTLTEDTVNDTSVPSSKAVYSIVDNLQTELNNVIDDNNKINNNLTWTRVDISLQSSNTAWSEVIVSAPKILTAKEFCLFDSANGCLTPIFPALTGGYIPYSNGMGASDPYCISGQFRVYSDGRIGYSPSRIGTAATAPKFIYLYYR